VHVGNELSARNWGIAWIALVLALALHVTDEALTGFLPLYNEIVGSIRESIPWFPFPTFTFAVWISGLVTLVFVLLAVSPLVFQGHAWLRPIAYFLAVLMIANAIAHATASLYWGIWAPGVYSSPVLLVAAAALLVATRRTKSQDSGGAGDA
jgi:hypothetical protein